MTIEGKLNQNSVMMVYIMSCYGAGSMSKYDNRRQAKPELWMMVYNMSCYGTGSMSKYDNRRLAKPEFCDDGVYNVMLRCWEYE